MKKEDLLKKLEKVEIPVVELKSHKRKLQLTLSEKFEGEQQKGVKNFNSWNFFSSLKKAFPVMLLVVFVFAFFTYSKNFFTTPTTYAQQLVAETIKKLSYDNNVFEKSSHNHELIIKILKEAQESHELKYLGEEIVSPEGNTIKKLAFTDEDLAGDLIIAIEMKGNLITDVQFQFLTDYIPLKFIEGTIKNGVLLDAEKLREKLTGQNIKKQWIKDLIHTKNKEWLENIQITDGLPSSSSQPEGEEKAFKQALAPIVESSEVLISGSGSVFDHTKGSLSFTLSTYELGNQPEKRKEAQGMLGTALEKLHSLSTDQAQMKAEFLSMAIKAPNLKYYPWEETFYTHPSDPTSGRKVQRFSFIDKVLTSSEITIFIDPSDSSDQAVQFYFISPGGRSEILEDEFKNGKVEHPEKLKDQTLINNPYKDSILKAIIKPQNERWLEEMGLDPQMNKEFLKLLKSVVEVSELSLKDTPYFSKNAEGQITGFALNVHPFNIQQDYLSNADLDHREGKKEIDSMFTQLIEDSTKSDNEDAQAKMAFLKLIQKIGDIRYQGEILAQDQQGIYHYANADLLSENLLLKKFKFYNSVLQLKEDLSLQVRFLYDPTMKGDSAIQIELMGIGSPQIIKAKVKNNKIVEPETVLKALSQSKLASAQSSAQESLLYLIKSQTQKWLQSNLSWTSSAPDQGMHEIVEQLKPLLLNSKALISGIDFEREGNKEITEVILYTY